MWTENQDKEKLDEAERILQTLLETTKDIDIRCQAIKGLVTHYSYWLKDDVRALEMANRLPALKDCREFAKAWHVKNNTGSYLQEVIERCTEYLTVNIKEMVLDNELPDDESTWEQKIRMLQTANEITRMIFGEDMMYHHSEVSYYAKHMSVYQLALGRTEDALDSLEEMVKHAIACDVSSENDRGKHFTSPFVSALAYPEVSDDLRADEEHNQCWYRLELLSDSCYDCIRDHVRFQAIVKELESRAK